MFCRIGRSSCYWFDQFLPILVLCKRLKFTFAPAQTLTGYQVTPILGAVVSDQYLGKYNTILYFSFAYLAGVLILFCTALPAAIEHGAALPGLIVAMVKQCL